MRYKNDAPMATLAMERDRTGNYGEDGYYEAEEEQCPVCGHYDPLVFYVDINEECVGCSNCVETKDTLRDYSYGD